MQVVSGSGGGANVYGVDLTSLRFGGNDFTDNKLFHLLRKLFHMTCPIMSFTAVPIEKLPSYGSS